MIVKFKTWKEIKKATKKVKKKFHLSPKCRFVDNVMFCKKEMGYLCGQTREVRLDALDMLRLMTKNKKETSFIVEDWMFEKIEES